jgi:hypothetical protein
MVKTDAWIVLLALVISAAGQQQQNKVSESWTIIRAGSLIDGKSDKPRHDQVIVIHGKSLSRA